MVLTSEYIVLIQLVHRKKQQQNKIFFSDTKWIINSYPFKEIKIKQ